MRESAANILVVDDDANLRQAVSIRLTLAGYRVHQAASGEDALLACAPDAPDAVILDVNLPGIDGFRVCETLRRTVNKPQLGVIFLTGAARNPNDHSWVQRGNQVGGDYFLAKPYDPELLVRLVDEVVGAAAAAQS